MAVIAQVRDWLRASGNRRTLVLRLSFSGLDAYQAIEVTGPRPPAAFAPTAGIIKPDGRDATWFSTIGGNVSAPPRSGKRIRFEFRLV